MRGSREGFYNAHIKEEYIDSIIGDSFKYITRFALLKVSEEERAKDKDLYEMTLSDIEDVMYGMEATSELSSYHNALRLEEYINWAAKRGYSRSNITPFDQILDKVEWSKQFVLRYRRSVFTREQLLGMCGELLNVSDRAILLALFEGIKGKDYSEITNLELKDLYNEDGAHKINLYDIDGNMRVVTISEELSDLLWRADQEGFYINKNGKSLASNTSESLYIESDEIFKKSRRGRQSGNLDGFFIQRKFTLFKKVFELKYLNARQIINSGMMSMAHELHERDGEFLQSHFDEIGEQFDVSMIERDGYVYRNTTIIRRVLRMPEFEELYGYKIIN